LGREKERENKVEGKGKWESSTRGEGKRKVKGKKRSLSFLEGGHPKKCKGRGEKNRNLQEKQNGGGKYNNLEKKIVRGGENRESKNVVSPPRP